MSDALETGLAVAVEAVAPLVRPWLHLIPETSRALPPHVTLLYPFLPPGDVDAHVEWELEKLFGDVAPFDFALSDVACFPDAVYLRPEPASTFTELTGLIWRHWPEYPPFGGQFDEVIPHLTVALDAEPGLQSIVEEALGSCLPVAARAERVLLFEEGSDGFYSVRRSFALRGESDAGASRVDT